MVRNQAGLHESRQKKPPVTRGVCWSGRPDSNWRPSPWQKKGDLGNASLKRSQAGQYICPGQRTDPQPHAWAIMVTLCQPYRSGTGAGKLVEQMRGSLQDHSPSGTQPPTESLLRQLFEGIRPHEPLVPLRGSRPTCESAAITISGSKVSKILTPGQLQKTRGRDTPSGQREQALRCSENRMCSQHPLKATIAAPSVAAYDVRHGRSIRRRGARGSGRRCCG